VGGVVHATLLHSTHSINRNNLQCPTHRLRQKGLHKRTVLSLALRKTAFYRNFFTTSSGGSFLGNEGPSASIHG
jgi:hypothetical protein